MGISEYPPFLSFPTNFLEDFHVDQDHRPPFVIPVDAELAAAVRPPTAHSHHALTLRRATV